MDMRALTITLLTLVGAGVPSLLVRWWIVRSQHKKERRARHSRVHTTPEPVAVEVLPSEPLDFIIDHPELGEQKPADSAFDVTLLDTL